MNIGAAVSSIAAFILNWWLKVIHKFIQEKHKLSFSPEGNYGDQLFIYAFLFWFYTKSDPFFVTMNSFISATQTPLMHQQQATSKKCWFTMRTVPEKSPAHQEDNRPLPRFLLQGNVIVVFSQLHGNSHSMMLSLFLHRHSDEDNMNQPMETWNILLNR